MYSLLLVNADTNYNIILLCQALANNFYELGLE